MRIYLDIETIPSQRNDVRARIHDAAAEAARTAPPPGNYKKEDAIARWREARIASAEHEADEEWRRTALDGGYGELACICWAFDEGPVETASRASQAEPEADVLAAFYLAVARHVDAHPTNRPHFAGHNIGFDLRFLHHRSVVLGVRPPVYLHHNAAAWNSAFYDTQWEWCGRDFIKLTALCDILGIDVHDDIDGSQVWDAFRSGEVDKVVAHCRADVERVRQVAKRLAFER